MNICAFTTFSPFPSFLRYHGLCILLRNPDASQDPKEGPAQRCQPPENLPCNPYGRSLYAQRHAPRTIVDISDGTIMQDYTRHHVSVRWSTTAQRRGGSTPHPDFLTHVYSTQYADYPAILPCERSKALLGRELTPEENSIRGTLVTGFTNKDFMFLDAFEGNVRLSLSLLILSSRLTTWSVRCFGSCGLIRNMFARKCRYIH